MTGCFIKQIMSKRQKKTTEIGEPQKKQRRFSETSGYEPRKDEDSK